jgi:hypothetical protein
VLGDAPGVERVAGGCGEDQVPFLPGFSGGLAFGVLGLAVLGEGGEAGCWDGNAAFGGAGFGGVEGRFHRWGRSGEYGGCSGCGSLYRGRSRSGRGVRRVAGRCAGRVRTARGGGQLVPLRGSGGLRRR